MLVIRSVSTVPLRGGPVRVDTTIMLCCSALPGSSSGGSKPLGPKAIRRFVVYGPKVLRDTSASILPKTGLGSPLARQTILDVRRRFFSHGRKSGARTSGLAGTPPQITFIRSDKDLTSFYSTKE